MKAAFTWWKDGDHFLGHLVEYPDFETQGETLEELKEHLMDLHHDLSTNLIPKI